MYYSISVCRYAPRVSNQVTLRPSFSSAAAVISIISVVSVGDAFSYLFIISCCLVPSDHAWPFMSPLYLSFRNISDATASCSCLFVSLVASTITNVFRKCSCVSFFVNSPSPCSLNLFIPVLGYYSSIMVWIICKYCSSSVKFSITSVVLILIYPLSWVLPSSVRINISTFFPFLFWYPLAFPSTFLLLLYSSIVY